MLKLKIYKKEMEKNEKEKENIKIITYQILTLSCLYQINIPI